MISFQETLKELIIEKGMSLRKIGKESGFTSGQLSEYLHGTYPSIERAIKLANYFNCSLDYLFGIVDERNYASYNDKPFDLVLFIKRYEELLKINNTTHWKFTNSCELAESILRHWKKGHKPLLDSLQIIALNLNGSIDYLVGRVDKY